MWIYIRNGRSHCWQADERPKGRMYRRRKWSDGSTPYVNRSTKSFFFFTTEGSDRLLLSHSLSNCRGGQQQSALVDRLMERSCSCSGPPPSQLKPIHSPPPPFPPTSSASKGGMKTLESARHRKRGILISLSLPLPLLWAPNFKDWHRLAVGVRDQGSAHTMSLILVI